MTRLLAWTVSLSLLVAPAARAEAVQSLQRPNGAVLDTTGELLPSAAEEINQVATAIRAAGHGELAVVVIKTTAGRDPRSFATELFNRWGLGSAARHDGVLLLVALRDRKAEIILGEGVDSAQDLARSDSVMRDQVVANLRRGDLGAAMLGGARGLQGLLAASRINASLPVVHTGSPPAQAPAAKVPPLELHKPRGSWVMDLDSLLSPALEGALNQLAWDDEASGRDPLLLVVYDGLARRVTPEEVARRIRAELHPRGWALILSPSTKRVWVLPDSPPKDANDLEQMTVELQEAVWGLLTPLDEATAKATPLYLAVERAREFARTGVYSRSVQEHLSSAAARHRGKLGLGFAGLAAAVGAWLRRYLRYRPRSCEHCGTPRQRLDEQGDDPHLTEGQRREEALASVDYDVWWCGRCRDALILRNRAWLTRYKACPQCDFVTRTQTGTTLQHATYDHGGVVEVAERCEHCSYARNYLRHTPRLTRSSSSSSRSGFRSSSSSFSSGGRSSGRGSSGSW